MMNKSKAARLIELVLLLFTGLTCSALAQATRTTTINGRVQLDSTQNFNFSSLAIGVHYTVDERTRRQADIFITPDRDGKFSASVPVNRRIEIIVESSDPTVRHATASENRHDFYRLGPVEWEMVNRTEFTVPPDAPEQIERIIELHRGAAFVLDVPSQLKRGAVYFRKSSWGSNAWTNVILFYEGNAIHHDVIGGLEAGEWLVTYYNGNDRKLKTRKLNLSNGQILMENK